MKVISLFSGAGGLDLGFRKAGAKVVYANDIQEDFCETYQKSLGEEIECKNVENVGADEIPRGEVVIGGFPCLGFTIARGQNRNEDPKEEDKNFLYKEYLRIVDHKEPKIFLMENVPGIKGGDKFEDMFEQILSEARDSGPGYNMTHEKLNAVHWGVPQNRERIIILGVRENINPNYKLKGFLRKNPVRTHMESQRLTDEVEEPKSPVTIREAIGDLPIEETDEIPNHVGSKHKVKLNGYQGNRRLEWDEPSPTITGRGSLTGGPVIHPHPSLERRLTVRECARLQSFPDNFVFYGSMSKCYAQIGNAVPPLFAFRLAQTVMKMMDYRPKPYKPEDWELPWAEDIPQLDSPLIEGI